MRAACVCVYIQAAVSSMLLGRIAGKKKKEQPRKKARASEGDAEGVGDAAVADATET